MRRRVQSHTSEDHILTVWSGCSAPFQVRTYYKRRLAIQMSLTSEIGCLTWEQVFSLIDNVSNITYVMLNDGNYIATFHHPLKEVHILSTDDFLTNAVTALNKLNKEYYEKSFATARV